MGDPGRESSTPQHHAVPPSLMPAPPMPAPPMPAPPMPGAPMPAPPVAAPRRRGKRRVVLVVVAIVLVCLILLAGLLAAYMVVVGGSIADNVPRSAEVGQCYGDDGSLQPVDCDGPHHFEVFAIVEYHAWVDYPGRFRRLLGNVLCDESFELYTGKSILDLSSPYDYSEVYPSGEDWENGARLVPCVMFHDELDQLNGRVGNLDAVLRG